jgi:hypothetical protein
VAEYSKDALVIKYSSNGASQICNNCLKISAFCSDCQEMEEAPEYLSAIFAMRAHAGQRGALSGPMRIQRNLLLNHASLKGAAAAGEAAAAEAEEVDEDELEAEEEEEPPAVAHVVSRKPAAAAPAAAAAAPLSSLRKTPPAAAPTAAAPAPPRLRKTLPAAAAAADVTALEEPPLQSMADIMRDMERSIGRNLRSMYNGKALEKSCSLTTDCFKELRLQIVDASDTVLLSTEIDSFNKCMLAVRLVQDPDMAEQAAAVKSALLAAAEPAARELATAAVDKLEKEIQALEDKKDELRRAHKRLRLSAGFDAGGGDAGDNGADE